MFWATDDDCKIVGTSTYNFWGVNVRVQFTRPKDQVHYDYYFQDHAAVGATKEPDYEILVSADLTHGINKPRIFVRRPGEEWHALAQDGATPLPPFRLPPLNSRLRTVHASAVHGSSKKGMRGTLVLHGASKVGKSTLLLGLLNLGWDFVTDDTLVVEQGNCILRYSRPVGVRERTLQHFPWLLKNCETGKTFTTPTGVTHAIHPTDLGFSLAPERTLWRWTVTLHRSQEFAVEQCGPYTLRISMDIELHRRQTLRAIADLIHQNNKGTSKTFS